MKKCCFRLKKKTRSTKTENFSKELFFIEALLEEAKGYHLDTEVVAWSLKAMKENPNLSLEEAFQIGYHEWIK